MNKHPLLKHNHTVYMSPGSPLKDIIFQTSLNDLLMNTPTLFKANYTATCFENPPQK
jgi:hypothetical protein